jgi:hypothetical protein
MSEDTKPDPKQEPPPYPDDIAKPEVTEESPSPKLFPDPHHEAHLRRVEKERMHDEGDEKDKDKPEDEEEKKDG